MGEAEGKKAVRRIQLTIPASRMGGLDRVVYRAVVEILVF